MNYETAARCFLTCIVLAISTDAAADPGKSVVDGARSRVYAIARDGIEVLEAGSRRQVAFVTLNDWVWAGEKYSCPPGIALAPEGDVLVTSNVLPVVWRIDRRTLAAKAYTLKLEQDLGRDIGFISIRWSRNQGVFVAVSNADERWIINASLTSARRAEGLVVPEAGPMKRLGCM